VQQCNRASLIHALRLSRRGGGGDSIDACVDTRFMMDSPSYAQVVEGSCCFVPGEASCQQILKCSSRTGHSPTPPPTEMMSLASNVQQTTKLALGVCSRITGKLVLGVCVLAPPASIGLLHSDLPGVFGTGIHPGC
jgi:hypothetical protein